MMLFSRDFWSVAFERMVKTIAQGALAALTASTFIPSSIDQWVQVAVTAGLAGLYSVLTSLTSYDAVSKTVTADSAIDVKTAVEVGARQEGPTAADLIASKK